MHKNSLQPAHFVGLCASCYLFHPFNLVILQAKIIYFTKTKSHSPASLIYSGFGERIADYCRAWTFFEQ